MARKTERAPNNYSHAFLLFLTGAGVGWLLGLSMSPVLHIIVGSIIALVAGAVGSLIGLHQSNDNDESSPDSESKHRRSRKNMIPITPLPLTMLVIGLGIGACAGIYARTNDFFGPNPQRFARKWAGTGLDEKELQQRLFNRLYPTGQLADEPEKTEEAAAEPVAPSKTSDQSTRASQRSDDGATSSPPTDKKIKSVKAVARHEREQAGTDSRQFSAGLYRLTIKECNEIRLKKGAELTTVLKARNDSRITAAIAKCKDNDACLEELKERLCPTK